MIELHNAETFAQGIPHDLFTSMRADPSLTWTAGQGDTAGFWSVGRHADLVAVSRDTDTYSSATGHIQIYDIDADALEARASMIDLDPPVHTRLRRLVSSAFTPRHVELYRQAVRGRVRRSLDQLEANGGGEWVSTVAAPIPIGVICDIMGVPEEDHQYMIELSDHLVAGTAGEPLEPSAYGNTTALRLLPFNSPAAYAMADYAERLADRRRHDPQDDLVTKLINTEVEGESLNRDEFSNFFRLMIFAGNETTRSSMAHLALHLVHFKEAFEVVEHDRSLLSTVADEVVRYSSPILYFRRTVTRPTVLSGTELAEGDKVVMWYASANFDETVFDDPMMFQPGRSSVPTHVAFGGGGAHFCLGASLARLEVAELIKEILDRRLDIVELGEATFVESNFVNGIEHLDVKVSRRGLSNKEHQ